MCIRNVSIRTCSRASPPQPTFIFHRPIDETRSEPALLLQFGLINHGGAACGADAELSLMTGKAWTSGLLVFLAPSGHLLEERLRTFTLQLQFRGTERTCFLFSRLFLFMPADIKQRCSLPSVWWSSLCREGFVLGWDEMNVKWKCHNSHYEAESSGVYAQDIFKHL